MKIFKRILKYLLIIILLPISYILIALILSYIPVNTEQSNDNKTHEIFLSTNGVHIDIILAKGDIDNIMLNMINETNKYQYYAFGWGDENFYLNTPTWADLTFSKAFSAMFLKSSTLIHLTRYYNKRTNWVSIKISDKELEALNKYIYNSFVLNEQEGFKLVLSQGYSTRDKFYKANGSYSIFYTCNSWANDGLKQSGIKSCVWTPFDFPLINKHKN